MPSFAQEEQNLSSRKWKNGVLLFAAAAALVGALLTSGLTGEFAGMTSPIIAGILGVTGIGALVAGYIGNSGLEKEEVDLQARKSASGLTQSLQAKGIHLTPEQQAAIEQDEYNKTSVEWRDRIEEIKRAREIGD